MLRQGEQRCHDGDEAKRPVGHRPGVHLQGLAGRLPTLVANHHGVARERAVQFRFETEDILFGDILHVVQDAGLHLGLLLLREGGDHPGKVAAVVG